jgi:hypothetical protein
MEYLKPNAVKTPKRYVSVRKTQKENVKSRVIRSIIVLTGTNLGLYTTKVYEATPCRLADGYQVSEEPDVFIVGVSVTLTMKTKPARFSQMLVSIFPTTRHHSQDDHHLHTNHCDSLKSDTLKNVCIKWRSLIMRAVTANTSNYDTRYLSGD